MNTAKPPVPSMERAVFVIADSPARGSGIINPPPRREGGKRHGGVYEHLQKVAHLVCPFRGDLSPLGGQVAVFWAYKLYCRYVRYVSLCISVFKITATYELAVKYK